MKTINVLWLFALMLFFNCSTNDEEPALTLPPITQTGENTFGCYIDGKLLVPRDGSGTLYSQDRGMRFITGGIPPQVEYYELKANDYKSEKTASLTIHFIGLYMMDLEFHKVNYSNCEDITYSHTP